MTDRKLFDIFYGAREGDHELCRRAYEAGCDINFAFDGRRATKGGAGRWYERIEYLIIHEDRISIEYDERDVSCSVAHFPISRSVVSLSHQPAGKSISP